MKKRAVIPDRGALPFSAVNRPGTPGHEPCQQKHHLLPRQLLAQDGLQPMFDALGQHNVGFDDFRRNGMLLPASENAAVRMGLPLHRGPHVAYSELVAERVGQIEGTWSGQKSRDPEGALSDALMRLSLLEQALRRWLLSLRRGATRLNRYDPLGSGRDFTELDAMADALWGATGAPELSPPSQAGLPFDDEG